MSTRSWRRWVGVGAWLLLAAGSNGEAFAVPLTTARATNHAASMAAQDPPRGAGRCTPELVESLVVHSRAPASRYFAIVLARTAAIGTARTGRRVSVRPIGWRILGQNERVCRAHLDFEIDGERLDAGFGVAMLATPLLFAADETARAFVRLGDQTFDEAAGLDLGRQREVAEALREGEWLQHSSVLNFWIDPRTPSTMWMLGDSCVATPDGRAHVGESARRGGITEIHCTSVTGDIVTPVADDHAPHRRSHHRH